MSLTECGHEPAVLAAARSGTWPAALSDHVASCPTCTETALVVGALCAAREDPAAGPLPDAGAIWSAARRDARRHAVARATLPITIMVRVSLGAVVVGVGGLLVWLWPAVAEQFAAVARSLTAPAASAPPGTAISAFVFATVATFTAALALFEAWAGE